VGGIAPKKGSTGTDSISDKCKQLDDANKEERKKFVDKMEDKQAKQGLNQDESAALDKAKRGGMTYSSASSTCGEGAETMTQSSSGLANAQITNGGEGGTSAQKMGLNKDIRESDAEEHDEAKEEAGVLCDKSYVHPGGGKGAHAEPKIINNLTNSGGAGMSGCGMVLNIDWRRNLPGGGVQQSGMPCASCYKMLCHAAKECEIDITLCGKNNEPVKFDKNGCDSDEGYENLCMDVDGGPAPGR
jgi:hypothetical protein